MRKLYYGLVMGFVFITVMWTCMSSIFGSMCGNHIVSQGYSPNRKFKFIVFVRSCGATTGFSTQVSIVTSDWKFRDDQSGNVLTTDDHYRGGKYNKFGGPAVTVKWDTNRRIIVQFDKSAETGTRKSKVKGIEIVYMDIP